MVKPQRLAFADENGWKIIENRATIAFTLGFSRDFYVVNAAIIATWLGNIIRSGVAATALVRDKIRPICIA